MADLDFYKSVGIADIDALQKALLDTFIKTNYSCDFFVDWEKVKKNRDRFNYKLRLLKSLGNSKDAERDLTNLLLKNPEVIEAIPILLACREKSFQLLESLDAPIKYKSYYFSKGQYSPGEIRGIVKFVKDTGLLEILSNLKSSSDYLLGIEVGLDSNARKNRSGAFLENNVTKVIKTMVETHPRLQWKEQESFGFIEKTCGIPIPETLKDRKFDYVLIYNNKATNLEVNYYGGTGSKPSEIVSSYINRSQVLTSAGWKFVWLTDGRGWTKMQRPLRVALENIAYVINLDLLLKGYLLKIVLS